MNRLTNEQRLQIIKFYHQNSCSVKCIVHFFFKDDEDRNVTVNGERYRAMNANFSLPKMEELDLADMWFQQNGSTCHTAREAMPQAMRGKFSEQLISRLGPVNWPPRSCDLTPVDYFLWGYVKAHVYSDKPATIDALQGVRYRPICWRKYAKIGPSVWTISSAATANYDI